MTRLAIFSCLLACAAPTPGHAANILYFHSSPSAFIGGRKIVEGVDGFKFTASRPFGGVEITMRNPPGGPNSDLWTAEFIGPNFTLPVPGYYPDAVQFLNGGSSHPGLDISGNGRGDNTLTGYFTVLELVLDGAGAVQKFAADFTQLDEGNPNWWNEGGIRFNSDLPITNVPEPTTATLLLLGMLGCGCRGRR